MAKITKDDILKMEGGAEVLRAVWVGGYKANDVRSCWTGTAQEAAERLFSLPKKTVYREVSFSIYNGTASVRMTGVGLEYMYQGTSWGRLHLSPSTWVEYRKAAADLLLNPTEEVDASDPRPAIV